MIFIITIFVILLTLLLFYICLEAADFSSQSALLITASIGALRAQLLQFQACYQILEFLSRLPFFSYSHRILGLLACDVSSECCSFKFSSSKSFYLGTFPSLVCHISVITFYLPCCPSCHLNLPIVTYLWFWKHICIEYRYAPHNNTV